MPPPSCEGAARPSPLAAVRLFLDFAVIGTTAFGGGSSALIAMRRLCVERRGWVTEAEYLDSFVLSRLSPGINILAQVILLGRRVAGWVGVAAAMAGMMLPAIVITVALSAGYQALRDQPEAQGPMAAVATLVAGFTAVLVIQLAGGLLQRRQWVRDAALVAACGGLSLAGVSPIVVLISALAAGALLPGLVRSGTEHT